MTILNVPEKLEEHIRKETEKSGYQLLDINTRGGKTFFMEIIIDREGGITLDECGDFNRKISSWIDGEKLFEGGYTLDVCSPGLDRELKNENDFIWAKNKEIKVTTHEAVRGESAITGKLVEAEGEREIVVEKEDGKKLHINKKNIAKARLWVKV
jgi:ribosome maturation factor RimP